MIAQRGEITVLELYFNSTFVYELPIKAMLQICIIIAPRQLRDRLLSLSVGCWESYGASWRGRPEVDIFFFGAQPHDGAPSDGKVNRLKC